METRCVRKRDKTFISLKNKYNVSSATLENAIHSWYKDSNNADYISNEFNSYLEDYLCLSNTPYTSKAKYDKAHKVWEDVITKYSTFSKDKIKVVKTMAALLFDEDDFTIYETAKPGVYTLKVKEPVYKSTNKVTINLNPTNTSEEKREKFYREVIDKLGKPLSYVEDNEGYYNVTFENGNVEVVPNSGWIKVNKGEYVGNNDINLFIGTLKAIEILKSKEPIYKQSSKKEVAPEEEKKNNTFKWARTAENNYEVSTRGDKRFSALVATFKEGTVIDGVDVGGMTIEDVYQSVIKKSRKGQAPVVDSKLNVPYRVSTEGITKQYGVVIDKNLKRNYSEWQNANPNGIVAYRVNYSKYNTPEEALAGRIGNPFSENTKDRNTVEQFFVWLTTGNNFDNPKATEEYRQAILHKLISTPKGTNILYYTELNRPSHATVLGYLINHKEFITNYKDSIEDFSYTEGYLPLWQEWARQNPELIQELREKSAGKTLTDQFANTRASQARALADILNNSTKEVKRLSALNAKLLKHKGNWSRAEAIQNPNILYVFTDNTDRDSGSGRISDDSWYSKKYGKGHHFPTMTAAVVRGLNNARPISTQRWYHQGAKGTTGRWTDADINEFKKTIREELQEIINEFNTNKYDTIMFPDGDGLFNTRISNITRERTPKLYQALGELLHEFGLDSLIPSDITLNIKQNEKKNTTSVTKIISGGQTGVDTIGLQVAKELGIETGGTAPRGFLREKGIDNEDIKSYGLVEITPEEQADYTKRKGKTDSYTGRTELNVRNSDGTVYFATDDDSAGLIATERSAKEWKKPFIKNPTAKQLIEWIKANNIRVLNVAGNRGSKLPKNNRVAKILREALQGSKVPEVDKLSESRTLVQQIIEDSKRRITFDKETHTYIVDGKKADTSVTQYIHGKKDIGAWGLPSSILGTTVDEVTRDYFSGKLKKSYPNLTKSQRDNLISDLDRLREQLDTKFGKGNYEVITTEFPIASKYTVTEKNGKRATKVMAGTMDMLVYDNEGNFYIYDMKTSRSGIKENTKVGYSKQLSLYKSILEANYPQLKGKIKELNLIEFSLRYPDPSDVTYYKASQIENGIEGQLYVEDENGDIINIQDSSDYTSPRLKTTIPIGESRMIGLEALDSADRAIVEEEVGTKPVSSDEYTPSKSTMQRIGWDNSPLLTATEKRFLSNQLMKLSSFIISHLQSSSEANKHYFGNTYKVYDFTKMSRNEIIETIGIGNIFNYIKEEFYNPNNRLDIDDFDTLDKLQVAYDNFEAMAKQGYSKLIALEDITVLSAKPEFIKREDIEESLGEEVEQGSLEEKEREYWQIGQRQLSAKASLSSTIRRLFERLPVVDQNGNPIKDEFGFNMDTFVDSGEAINSILTWVNAATTIEEMESILSEMAPANPWLNNILEAIKEEPVRSQFFQNFRKDFLTYSVVRVEYDSNGNRQYVTDIINTQGAAKTILNNTVTSFKLGLMTNLIIPIRGDLEGRGRVNVESVKSLKESVSKITKSIQSSFEGTDRKAINSNINDLAEVLSRVGLPITPAILKTAFASDVRSKNYSATKVGKVLTQLSYMLDTLLDNKGNTEYGPLMKGSEGNIYSNYKNIVNVLSPYIQDSVESSTYENGKMYYSFTTPSYMGKLINKLSDKLGDSTKFKDFIEQEYGSYKWFKQGNTWNCPWLDRITSSESIRQGLQHKVQLTFDRTNYTDLSELSYTLSLMQEYFYDKNKKWAWFRLPILANKPSSEFVRFERLSGKNYQTKIKKGLRKVFNQELMRMRTVLERADNPDIEKIGAKGKVWFDIKSLDPKLAAKFKKGKLTLNDLVKDGKYIFSGSGAEFKFLSPINLEIINKTELGQLIVDKLNGKDVNESNLDKLFYKAVDVFMARQMEVERANWERLGLFETEKVTRKIDGKEVTKERYKYISQLGNSDEEINANLEEYVWNDMFATINIIELTATDLAYYKNVEDFQKRYSQVHAPSMRLNVTAKDDKGVLYSADGFERTVYLKDSIAKSDIIANVAKVFNDKIATLRGAQKRDMEIMRDLILTEFENINVADAQGYSSPTSYRKKMGMQGKWTPEMEEAYRQIREGNLNINNLGVVWQPLKPFVYSQIRKTSGATTMSELKVPVQNKNSEYLLLIADAIMRSGKQVNKLQAIFDFMEDSAYDNGEYNGKGIDTVQFISAVNSGGMGAIDINSAESYEEVKSLLEEAAYYHKDKSTTSDNDNDRYNEQYVHTIPFEDYGIQQEVPAHLSDHKQAMGSQVRILSVSDISSDARFTIGNEEYTRDRLHKEYFDLIAENIKDSYEKLKKDLGLSGSRIEQNKKLSALLQETILKDQRYGADLLKACSLDEKGEFVIPPSDPIQSTRIQQLLNSIIKNRINKQKVQGGPAVQASAFGLSDDLHIIWQDKDGNLLQTREEFKGTDAQYNRYVKENQHSVAFFECYAPIPSKDMEMALLKPDGTYMTPQEAVAKKIITDEMLKAIGYRIPTEDKYSIIPLKIKGFVPKAAGEAIIMPKEITKTTGADFDIDEMYIMFKEFQKKETTNWRALKSDIKKLRPSAPKKKLSDDLYIAIDQIKNGKIEFSEGSFEMMVFDYLQANIDSYRTVKFEEKGEDASGDRNNRIFDIQWAVLTNSDTMHKMFNPGSFDVQKKSARIISILKTTNKYSYAQLSARKLEELDEIIEASSNLNIVFPSTQVYFHKQNMTAGKLIGIFANNNTSHAFLSMQDIHFNIDDEKAFTFNGITISNTQNNKVDALEGKDGTLISKTIAGFLAASVDAVKDPVLNHMNLNIMTANPAMVLARLGFDSDSIGLLLTQPIIEKITSEYFKRNNEGYAPIEDIIDEELESLNINYDALDKDLINTDFTKEELAKGIMKGDSTTEFQIRALLLFQRLAEMGKDLNTLTFLTKFNSVTNAVGPTIADTFVMRERYNRFLDDMNSETPPFNSAAADVIDNNAMLSAFYETTVGDKGASSAIFSRYFPHYSSAFTTVLRLLRETTKGNIDSKTINKLVNDFILYKLTIGNNPVLNGSYESRSRYINGFVREFSEKSKDIVGNDFINIISVKPRNSKCPVDALESKTGGYSIDVQERVKDGWSDLLGNSSTTSLGQDLFFYNLFRSGFNFSPKTPGHLASVDVRRAIPGYIEAISNPEFEDEAVIAEEFLNQFRRNHTQDAKIVPSLKSYSKDKTEKSRNIRKENVITFKFDKRKSGLRPIIVSDTSQGITWAPVIVFEDKVYMNPVGTDNSVTYTETTPLGNANNFLEYNYNEGSTMKSVISNTVISSGKEDLDPSPSNSSIQSEKKGRKSISAKAIDSAIMEVFGTREAESIAAKVDAQEATRKDFINYVVNRVLKGLGMSDNLLPVITRKVEDKVKDFCK